MKGLRDCLQHLGKARPPEPWFCRKIGASPEGGAIGLEKHCEWPTSLLSEEGESLLVEMVEIRPLLPIQLDVDKKPVHQGCDLGILEALIRHDVAPVAGRVAHGEQDRLVLLPRERKRLFTPRHPMDRIVRVLKEVRARFA